MRTYKIIFTLLWLAVLAGCATSPEDLDETKDWSAERFFNEASSALSGGDYETAINFFEKLEARYPFGKYAQQAQLQTAYAYYKFHEPESAISSAERFIKLHPRNAHVDYAYYLRGLASFPEEANFVEGMVGKDPSQLDPGGARRSFNYFAELVKKYPDSKYTEDAKKRMLFLRNTLAKHEVNVANFYMQRGAFVAAANRAKYVIKHYQHTPAVTDALFVLSQAYKKMDLNGLATDTERVIELNKKTK
jgi:outer membrane protein assembly factor BamD